MTDFKPDDNVIHRESVVAVVEQVGPVICILVNEAGERIAGFTKMMRKVEG